MLSVKIKKRLGDSKRSDSAIDGFLLDVAFSAQPGVTILFGASGSGKTMTLKSIAGIIRPDEGLIKINDDTLFDSERALDLKIRQRGVGYVFQNLALFPHLSARDNVEFGMTDQPKTERRKRAAAMMEALRIEHAASRKPRDISGGEAQRVALARALSCRPRILLLDEPLSAIDEATKRGIISDLKSINRELRLPIVYVTHSREEAITLGERVIVYERGRIVTEGEPLEVFGAPITASVARLTGVENIFEGRIVAKNESGGTMTVEITGETEACRVEVPFGNESEDARIRVAVPAGDILLATEEPRSTSARNRLRGRIAAIEDKGNRTVISVKSGVVWRASVTRQAVSELDLSNDKEVWLAFKTYSCYLLDE
ncbi:MAG TPA: ATP-binding cassette domain-containing protein [Blastocatellia bacterium]|nr:ATP-binding cassette domain-containing protein [Blastocatellia bacterium]